MKKIKIAPSILSCDFGNLEKEIRLSEEAGADLLHLDIMDNHFVPNLTMGPTIVNTVRKLTKLPLDVHLMIDNPGMFVDDYIEAGADIVFIHAEAYVEELPDPKLIKTTPRKANKIMSYKINPDIQHIKAQGKKAGIVLNPDSPISCIENLLSELDMVLLMSVYPGFSGQKFIPETLDKIAELRKIFQGEIMIDGGINDQTSKPVIDAGADILVSASYFYGSSDYKVAIEKLKNS